MQKITFYAGWMEKISIFLMPITVITLIMRWTQDKIPVLKNMNFWLPYMDRNNISSMCPDSLNFLRNISFEHRVIGFLVESITMVIVLAALFYCIKLMRCFYKGEIFSLTTVSLLRKMSKLALLWAIYTPICGLLLSVFVFHETAETTALSLGYAVDNAIIKLLIFGFFLVISLMMQEGFRLKSEQDLTV